MTDIFIPAVKNPPAKVKDAGLINMAMEGACVYNAKSGEVILLPKGVERMENCTAALRRAFFTSCGAQTVSAAGFDSIRSLAERYVREYGAGALNWAWQEGRMLHFGGWAASAEESVKMAEAAAEALAAALADLNLNYSLCRVVEPRRLISIKAVSETVKGALSQAAGFKCSVCGSIVEPDSTAAAPLHPVNEGAECAALCDVLTPGAHTIPLLCEQLGLDIKSTLKAMLYTVEAVGGKELLFAMIRGDKDVSIAKLDAYVQKIFPGASFRRAEADEIVGAFGEVAGFCGPVGVPDNVKMAADLSLVGGKNFVVGGNRPNYHKTGCCWGRDFEPPAVDLMLFEESSPCPKCGGALKEAVLREFCSADAVDCIALGESVLSCRDREGLHTWPYRWNAAVSLESLLLALYENEKKGTI